MANASARAVLARRAAAEANPAMLREARIARQPEGRPGIQADVQTVVEQLSVAEQDVQPDPADAGTIEREHANLRVVHEHDSGRNELRLRVREVDEGRGAPA